MQIILDKEALHNALAMYVNKSFGGVLVLKNFEVTKGAKGNAGSYKVTAEVEPTTQTGEEK